MEIRRQLFAATLWALALGAVITIAFVIGHAVVCQAESLSFDQLPGVFRDAGTFASPELAHRTVLRRLAAELVLSAHQPTYRILFAVQPLTTAGLPGRAGGHSEFGTLFYDSRKSELCIETDPQSGCMGSVLSVNRSAIFRAAWQGDWPGLFRSAVRHAA